MKNDGLVSASEIGEYVYCKRAWYLRQQGLLEVTWEMREGTIKHTQLFLRVQLLSLGKKVALLLLIGGALLLALLYLISIL